MTQQKAKAGYEVQAGTIEEFLRLLDLREAEADTDAETRPVVRCAVYVTGLQDVS